MRNLQTYRFAIPCLLAMAAASTSASTPSRPVEAPRLRAVAPARPPSADDVDPALRADIIKLMELTGSADLGRQMATIVAEAALQSFRNIHPELPTRAYLVAQDVLKAEYGRGFSDPDGFLATVIPMYAKHFTHDEVRALIAFYDSDLGRKNVALIPTLVDGYQELGKQWAVEMTPQVQQALRQRLEVEGFLLN